ncbi:MAG: hypothetical protein KKB34_12410 [Bacteroidetes bacterium]|jgi:hypothetical protein|nr:hypothetical protein [Bacteroidota bacterium]
MMKKIFLIVLFLFSIELLAQVDITTGMGISFVNNSSLQDYINSFPLNDKLETFNSSFETYLEGDYSIGPKFQLGVEYVFQIFSFNSPYAGLGQYDLTYVQHKPSLLAYYVISGNGFKIKFGGGAGPRFVNLDEKILSTTNYKSSGFGLLGRIQAHTKLGDNFYANIGSTLRYDHGGVPENNTRKLHDNFVKEDVNINALSVSVNIGVSYFIGK